MSPGWGELCIVSPPAQPRVSVCVCVCAHVPTVPCPLLPGPVCLRVCLSVCACACGPMFPPAQPLVSVCVSVCVCACTRAQMCAPVVPCPLLPSPMCLCVCVCVCVCVCMRLRSRVPSCLAPPADSSPLVCSGGVTVASVPRAPRGLGPLSRAVPAGGLGSEEQQPRPLRPALTPGSSSPAGPLGAVLAV